MKCSKITELGQYVYAVTFEMGYAFGLMKILSLFSDWRPLSGRLPRQSACFRLIKHQWREFTYEILTSMEPGKTNFTCLNSVIFSDASSIKRLTLLTLA